MDIESNYLGNGKGYDGANGRDVAVSRGPAGEFMYDYVTIRDHVAAVQRDEPRSAIRYVCPLNQQTIAGFVPKEPDGSVIEFEMGAGGFLTKGRRIWHAQRRLTSKEK